MPKKYITEDPSLRTFITPNLLWTFILGVIFFLAVPKSADAEEVDMDNKAGCPKRHIGFDAVAAKKLDLTPKAKDPKSLESVSFTIDNGREDMHLSKGMPVPCALILEARGVPSVNKYERKTDRFDLAIKECSKTVPQNRVERALKWFGNAFKKDANKKNEMQTFSFNVSDKNTYLKTDYLKGLYSDGKINEKTKASFDKIFSKADLNICTLKSTVSGNGRSLDDYISCGNVVDVKNFLSKKEKLKDTCAIGQGSNAFENLFVYRTDPEYDKAGNENTIKECIKKYKDDDSVQRLPRVTLEVGGEQKVKKENDSLNFKSYDRNCVVTDVAKVDKDLEVIEHITDVANYYSDDIANCENCHGAKVDESGKIELTVRSAMDAMADPCLGGTGPYLDHLAKNCPDGKDGLSCTKVNSCSLNLSLEGSNEVTALPLSDFDATVKVIEEGIFIKRALPIHMAITLASEQGRGFKDGEFQKVKENFEAMKNCVTSEKRKYFKHLSMSSPRASSKFVASSLDNIAKLVDAVDKKFSSTTTEEKFMANAKEIKKLFDEFGKRHRELPKTEDAVNKVKLSDESCDALATLVNDPDKCKLSKEAMENTSKEIKEYRESLSEENIKKLDNAIGDISIENDTVAMVRYIELVKDPGFGSAKKTQNAVELLAIHDAISGATKDLEIQGCESTSESNFSQSNLSRAMGKGDKFLAGLKPKEADEEGPSSTASEATAASVEELKNVINGMQQQIAALSAQLQGNNQTQMMQYYMGAQIDAFKQYTSSLDSSFRGAIESNRNIMLYSMQQFAGSNVAASQQMYQQTAVPNYNQAFSPFVGGR